MRALFNQTLSVAPHIIDRLCMRKIRSDEQKAVSAKFAEIFKDYKAYDAFFPRDEKQQRKIYYFYRYEVYSSVDYTYTSDDNYTSLCSVKRPGDRDNDPKKLLADPIFFIKFIAATGVKACRLASGYMRFASEFANKFYDPQTDCYIKNIGVSAEARGQGRLKSMIDELCGGSPIYLETHDENNVKIYEHLGFEVVGSGAWYGITHYAMKRGAKS